MPVGTTLLAGRYRTIERVGSGGMATVLLAEDERLGRQVAVKLLHAESPVDTARRFRREAQLGASLNHPNIVSIYDIETDEEGVLIVMEYVEGETLRDAIARGPAAPGRALEVLRGVADALDHAHGEGIVHRDVKPANVLLGRDGRVKLADLGIATAVEGTRITKSGTVLGTAAYMAPEQLEGRKAGPAADVYSLAVVAWETLAGQRAYEGRSPLEIAHRKVAEPPPALTDVFPAAPAAVSDVLARAMGVDVQARPLTAGSLVDELEDALEDRPTAATSALPAREPVVAMPKPVRRSGSRFLPLVALLAALAIGAAAIFAFASGGDSGSGSGKNKASSTKKNKPKKDTTPASAQASAPDQSQPSEPAAPSTGYQLPTPSGSSAATGWQLNRQGKALSDRGDYESAIPVLERAVRSFPAGTTAAGNIQFAYTIFNLGHALNAAGRPADAIPVLEERLKNPDQRHIVQAELDRARAAAGQG